VIGTEAGISVFVVVESAETIFEELSRSIIKAIAEIRRVERFIDVVILSRIWICLS